MTTTTTKAQTTPMKLFTIRRSLRALFAAGLVFAASPAIASATTWTVDDDRAQCPNASFTSLQGAINQAAPWDTVVICDGTYQGVSNATTATNSPAQTGSKNGFVITKPMTIKGAGANKVFIEPDPTVAGATLAGTQPYLRDGGGAVIQINRQSGGSSDYTENFVDISGVTVRSPTVYAEAGIAFFNTSGKISDSTVGPLYRSADAAELALKPHGWGVVMTNLLQGASEAAVRREVTVEDSLITGYQSGGVLFDDARGTDGNAANTVRSGIIEYGTVTGSKIVGSGPSTVIPQTGVRYHAGARGSVSGSEVFGNSFTTDLRKSVGVLLTDATTGADPGNPTVRAFKATSNNISGNGYGLFNANITNDAVRLGAPALATGPLTSDENWWGCPTGPVVGGPSAGGCDGISGLDSGAAQSVEIGAPRAAAPAALAVPGTTDDDAPDAQFVDPDDGDLLAVGDTVFPVVKATDDFGIKSVEFTVDGQDPVVDTKTPYEFQWTVDAADVGSYHQLKAVVTDSAGQQTTTTISLGVPPFPVPPAPPAGGGGGGGAAPGATNPLTPLRVTKLKAKPSCASDISKIKISYRIAKSAKVKAVLRKIKGKALTKCIGSKDPKSGKKTKLSIVPGATKTRSAKKGKVTIALSKLIAAKELAPGRYRLTLTPKGGRPASVTFRII